MMMRFGTSSPVAVLRGLSVALTAAMLFFVMEGHAQGQSVMTRHVRPEVTSAQAKFVNRLPSTQALRLNIVLPLRDPAGLENFLQEVYDPTSPSYRHFLTPQEFTARFGPTQEDYDAVVQYALSSGFKVVGGSRDGMDVQVEGSVTNIEAAFNVSMGVYQHPTENRTFYAPDREPMVDLPFPLWHISGLDNYSIPHPLYHQRNLTVKSNATTGSGPSASFLGSDMRAAYYGNGPLTGAGQNLGLLEYYGTDLADLNTYFKNVGQTNNVPITLFSTDGTSTSCVYPSCDDTEQTLDMTQALGMAPGLASLVMFIGSTDTAIISAMTTYNPLPATISCSWGWTPADASTLNPYFEKMAAQGQNFFAASGDNSTWSRRNEAWPADNAYVVSVGGTDLTTASAGGPWKSETAWSDSGGGISPDSIAIPLWQQLTGVIKSSNKGSTTLRNGPDVSANANFTYYVCADQTTCTANEYGGTSFAAPLWAAYVALANQQALANGASSTLGFINPLIYPIGVSSSYGTDFHDITSGTSGSYSAVTGYDLVTGWGSMNGANLITALAGASTTPNFTLSASPTSVSVLQGNSGTSTITTAVLNGFDSAISLTAAGQPTGVTVSFSPTPTIAAPGSGTSTMTLAVASSTATGTYTITITGTSTSPSITQTATVSLTVTAPSSIAISSVSPNPLTLTRGKSATSVTVSLTRTNFTGNITLSIGTLPSGVTATSITQPKGGNSGSISLKAASNATLVSNQSITITASGSGVSSATGTFLLTVSSSSSRGH
jgi:kumamolisin